VLTIVLVVAAMALGTLAFTTWRQAQDTRSGTRPLESRELRLSTEVGAADVAIARFSTLFDALRAQGDATKAAVDAANSAAQRYNTAQSGIADALGSGSSTAASSLAQATTALHRAIANAQAALGDLASFGGASGAGSTGG
jgi:hypothetical protein